MKYYIRDIISKNKVFVTCPKLNGKRKICRSDEFDMSEDQWLIENSEVRFQNVWLICKVCGQMHIRAFDLKSFHEQFSKESLLKLSC